MQWKENMIRTMQCLKTAVATTSNWKCDIFYHFEAIVWDLLFFWFVCAFFPEPSRLYHRNAIYKNCNKWRQGIRRIRFRIIVLSLFIIIGVIGCRHRRHCGRVFFHFSLPSSIGFRVRFLVLIVSTHSVFCVFVCILLSSSSFCFVYKIFSLRSIYVSGVFLAE